MQSFIKKFMRVIAILLISAMSTSALSEPPKLGEVLSDMNRIGNASFKFYFWSVYEAELYAKQTSFDFTPLPSFILTLNYQRAFNSMQIVKETQKQLLEIHPGQPDKFEPWLNSLNEILTDVAKGDRLSLYVDSNKYSSFYLNGNYLGSIEDEDFSQSFSAIWLARDDHYADFTHELTGVL